MENIIIIAIITAITAAAAYYLIKKKHQGNGCIGCPYSKGCSGRCNDKNKNK